MEIFIPGKLRERQALEILALFPLIYSGKQNLLVTMDNFPKWPEVVPIPNQDASTIAEALLENITVRH